MSCTVVSLTVLVLAPNTKRCGGTEYSIFMGKQIIQILLKVMDNLCYIDKININTKEEINVIKQFP